MTATKLPCRSPDGTRPLLRFTPQVYPSTPSSKIYQDSPNSMSPNHCLLLLHQAPTAVHSSYIQPKHYDSALLEASGTSSPLPLHLSSPHPHTNNQQPECLALPPNPLTSTPQQPTAAWTSTTASTSPRPPTRSTTTCTPTRTSTSSLTRRSRRALAGHW